MENPNVKFSDIVGLDKCKVLIKEAIVFPLMYPQLFDVKDGEYGDAGVLEGKQLLV